MIINNYKVYQHTNLNNGKKYIGITQKPVKERWNNGNGYKANKKFYKDIQKYGWDDGFSHEIIKDNLSYKDARNLEKYYITKYDTVSNGYNNANFNEIIKDNLSYKDARNLEKYYITKYDTVSNGYNNANF
ncbi:hypothetical protein DXA10_14310, partial [Firmicutes bacterium AM55-24TS]